MQMKTKLKGQTLLLDCLAKELGDNATVKLDSNRRYGMLGKQTKMNVEKRS